MPLRPWPPSRNFGSDWIGDSSAEEPLAQRRNFREGDHLPPNSIRWSLYVNGRSNHKNGGRTCIHVLRPLHARNKEEQRREQNRSVRLKPSPPLHPVSANSSEERQWHGNWGSHEKANRALHCQRQQSRTYEPRREECNPQAASKAARPPYSINHRCCESHAKGRATKSPQP